MRSVRAILLPRFATHFKFNILAVETQEKQIEINEINNFIIALLLSEVYSCFLNCEDKFSFNVK